VSNSIRIFSLTASILIIMAAASLAAPCSSSAADFSAVMVSSSNGETMRSKVYNSGEKFRSEQIGDDQDEGGVVIVRQDKKVVWVLVPSEESYMEMPVTDQYSNPLNSGRSAVSKKDLGDDTVDGRATRKELVTVKDEDGTSKMYTWTDKELKIPVKAEDADGQWSYWYENIRPGKQDAGLFEVPRGYTRMSMGYGSVPHPSRPDYPQPPDYPHPPDYPDVPGIPTPW